MILDVDCHQTLVQQSSIQQCWIMLNLSGQGPCYSCYREQKMGRGGIECAWGGWGESVHGEGMSITTDIVPVHNKTSAEYCQKILKKKKRK